VPRYSPDGKWIAFERNSRELRADRIRRRMKKSSSRPVCSTRPRFVDARDFVWSPDSRFIAYLTAGAKTFQNVHVASVASGVPSFIAGEGRAVSFLANTNAGSLAWESRRFVSDVRDLSTHRARRGRPRRPPARTPKFREDQFRDLFKEDAHLPQPNPTCPSTPPAQAARPLRAR